MPGASVDMSATYPKARLLLADAISVTVTWFLLGIAAALWLACSAGMQTLEGAAKLSSLAFLLALLSHLVLALLHRCPHCGKHPTIQGFGPPHPHSLSQSRASGWAGVVCSVLRRQRFVCIHCGVGFSV